jgi:hypothetical protein
MLNLGESKTKVFQSVFCGDQDGKSGRIHEFLFELFGFVGQETQT